MLFRDRYDAALKLIPRLEKYKKDDGVVLAIPRGGVPIGYYIALRYHFPLEILLTKKIGHPQSKELAIGAVSIEDLIINEHFNVPEGYIENETKKIRESLMQRHNKFVGERKPVEIENKTVIIVDDGIATGSTIISGIKIVRQRKPKKIIVAAPVAPLDITDKIKREVDEYICAHPLENFIGVGLYYIDFSEVNDEEVIQLLNVANRTTSLV